MENMEQGTMKMEEKQRKKTENSRVSLRLLDLS